MLMAFSIIIFITSISSVSSLVMGVLMKFFVIYQEASFCYIHFLIYLFFLRIQCFFHLSHLLFTKIVREDNLKDYEEISRFVNLFMVWHSMILYCFNFIGLDDFSCFRFDSDLLPTDMVKNKVNSCQGLKQSNILFNQKVSSLPFKSIMRLFLNHYYNITCFHSWVLISFSMENIFFLVRCSLVNLNIQNLFLFHYFFSIAIFAFVFVSNSLSFTTTFITGTCSLGIHSWSKHLHHSSHTFSITGRTFSNCISFTSLTITFRANSISAHSNL